MQSVEFVPTEVGTHIIEVTVNGDKLPSGPLIAKVYDAGLIQVADVSGGVVGQPVQFRGKLKISLILILINLTSVKVSDQEDSIHINMNEANHPISQPTKTFQKLSSFSLFFSL